MLLLSDFRRSMTPQCMQRAARPTLFQAAHPTLSLRSQVDLRRSYGSTAINGEKAHSGQADRDTRWWAQSIHKRVLNPKFLIFFLSLAVELPFARSPTHLSLLSSTNHCHIDLTHRETAGAHFTADQEDHLRSAHCHQSVGGSERPSPHRTPFRA